MTEAEYLKMTDLVAIRAACRALRDVVEHQGPHRKAACQLMLRSLQRWADELHEEIEICP